MGQAAVTAVLAADSEPKAWTVWPNWPFTSGVSVGRQNQ